MGEDYVCSIQATLEEETRKVFPNIYNVLMVLESTHVARSLNGGASARASCLLA